MKPAPRRSINSQTEKLVLALQNGASLNFLAAFNFYRIQDLRKRLCEVRDLGYRLRHEDIHHAYFKVPLRTWSMDTPLHVGEWVRVKAAPVLMNTGTHPLRGKEGRILEFKNHSFLVGNEAGEPFGWFRHKDLERLGEFRHGQAVRLKPGGFTIVGRMAPESSGGSGASAPANYILERDGQHFYAAAPMLEAVNV